jgi:hypothetical protein
MQTTKENFIGHIDFDRFQRNVENARALNHEHWIGDIPVHPELLKFYKAFKAKRYNIVPCVDINTQIIWKRDGVDGETVGVGVYHRLGITFPDTTDFRSGSIFVEAADVQGKNEITYCVKSDDIENEKYSCGNDGYHVRQSKDMAKTVKLAMKYLTPLDYDDINGKCTGALNTGIYNLREPAREKVDKKMRIEHGVIAQEVAHMIASGYQPSTEAFKNALDMWAREGAELKRMQDYKPRACFVWVKPNSLSYKFTEDKVVTECTSMDDVPELVRNKLAVLQIAKNGDAIADVGVRVSDITYWVFA